MQISPGPLGMLSVGGTMWRVSGTLWDHHHAREARNKASSWSQHQLRLSEWMSLYCYWIWKLAFNSQKVTEMSPILHQISWKKCTGIQFVTLWDASHVLFFLSFLKAQRLSFAGCPMHSFQESPHFGFLESSLPVQFTSLSHVHYFQMNLLFLHQVFLSASKFSILFGLIFLNVWSITLVSTEKRIPRTARPSSPVLYMAFFWECSQQPDSSSSPTCHPQNSHWATPANPCEKKQTY